jgi:hypothetical protein
LEAPSAVAYREHIDVARTEHEQAHGIHIVPEQRLAASGERAGLEPRLKDLLSYVDMSEASGGGMLSRTIGTATVQLSTE